MTRSFQFVAVLASLFVAGCAQKFALPIDVHTQYVAAVMVTPQCLTRCDLNGDGLIQYRLWPGTETPSVQDPGSFTYGITERHGALSESVAEQDKQVDELRSKDDLTSNPYLELDCWQQCRGPVMAAVAVPAMTGEDGPAPTTAIVKPPLPADTEAIPY